jgi:predicted transcriptional regulator
MAIAMSKQHDITDAERQIMQVLWQQHPLSSREIIAAVEQRTGWNPKTVQTLIGRLHDKGILHRQGEPRRYQYSPAVKEEAFLSQRSRQFVGELFGGRVSSLVACFAEQENISAEELAELKRVVDALEADDDR